MKIIVLVFVLGVVLIDLVGAIPDSSVGGPMIYLLVVFIGILTVGVQDAWSNKRGVLGWIVSIVCAVIGGVVGVIVSSTVTEQIIPLLGLDGPLARSQHPMRYILPAGMMLLTLLGSWGAIQIVNRLR